MLTLVNATSSTTVQVEWDPPSDPNGIITSYIVCYYQISIGLLSIQYIEVAPGTSVELINLAIYTEYCVFVKANKILTTDTGVNSVKDKTFSFPYPVSLLSATWLIATEYHGDMVEFIVGEDTVIGVTSTTARPEPCAIAPWGAVSLPS